MNFTILFTSHYRTSCVQLYLLFHREPHFELRHSSFFLPFYSPFFSNTGGGAFTHTILREGAGSDAPFAHPLNTPLRSSKYGPDSRRGLQMCTQAVKLNDAILQLLLQKYLNISCFFDCMYIFSYVVL